MGNERCPVFFPINIFINDSAVRNQEVDHLRVTSLVQSRPQIVIDEIWIRALLEKELGHFVLAILCRPCEHG